MKYVIILFVFATSFNSSFLEKEDVKEYVKLYTINGNLIMEGWEVNGKREGYWKFYHKSEKIESKGHYSNGQKTGYWYYYDESSVVKEGHFKNGIVTDWWKFYDKDGYRLVKEQFKNGKRHGYSLFYKERRISMVKEYNDDTYLGSWTTVSAFRKAHPDFKWSDLSKFKG